MYPQELITALLNNTRFQNVYFNEKDDTQYIFHPNANFRKVVSRDEILNSKPVVSEKGVSEKTSEKIETKQKPSKK